MEINKKLLKHLVTFQRTEITEYHIYKKLARAMGPSENRKILEEIAEDEHRHYLQWRELTGRDLSPDWLKVWVYYLISRIFGLTFGIQLMERGEESAQENYAKHTGRIEIVETLIKEENEHEDALIGMIEEDRLLYVGSIVLGLNDALVELTGALAGLTFALQNTKLIALTGLIIGFAAALSMGASEYLSTRSEGTSKSPFRAAIYTGVAYIITVAILILPYLIIKDYLLCLVLTLVAALLVIAVFNFYVSVVRDEPFLKRFAEMAVLSLGVAGLSFIIGFAFRSILGIEI